MNINFIVSKVCLLHLGKNFVESIFPEMTKMHRIESFTTNGRNGYIITYELSFFEMIQKKKEKESNFLLFAVSHKLYKLSRVEKRSSTTDVEEQEKTLYYHYSGL